MKDYIDLFTSEYKSKGTRNNYRLTISRMLNEIGKDPQDIKRIDLVQYKSTMENLASATQAQRIICIKSYFKFLYENEIIDNNPAETIKAPVIQNAPKDALTIDEAITMMQYANKRERAIIAALLNTGIRVAELINLQLIDFINNPEEMTIKTKGGKYRKIVFNEDTIRLVNEYIEVRKCTEATNLFVSNQCTPLSPENLNSAWKKLARKAGINKHITTHSFRSAFVTDIAMNHGILMAQIAVNHANIATTRRYVRGIEDEAINIMKGLRVC